jgi:hypothetical protein
MRRSPAAAIDQTSAGPQENFLNSRTTVHTVVFDDKLWSYGGKTGRKDSWAGDVWTMICDNHALPK